MDTPYYFIASITISSLFFISSEPYYNAEPLDKTAAITISFKFLNSSQACSNA